MKKICLLIMVIVFVAAEVPAADVEKGFYLGGSFGRSRLTASDFYVGDVTFRFEDDDLSFKIFGGYRFLDYLALEAAWVDPGGMTAKEHTAVYGDLRLETSVWGFDGFVVGLVPIGSGEIFGKVGGIAWNSDSRIEVDEIVAEVTEVSDSGTGLAYGLGIAIRAKKATIRLEYEWFDILYEEGISTISVGGAYNF